MALHESGVFEAARSDPAFFELLTVENDTIARPNGADIDSDVLYLGLRSNACQNEWEAARERVAHLPRP